MKNKFLTLISACFLLAGCGISDVDPSSSSNPSSPGDNDPATIIEPDNGAKWAINNPNASSCPIRTSKDDVVYSDLFNLHNKVNISINMSNTELAKLEEDRSHGGKSEIYRLALSVTIYLTNGDNTFDWTFENVGVRQKGGVFTRSQVLYGDQVNTSNHYKISFDETFSDTSMYDQDFINAHKNNDYKDREFLGLSGFDIKYDRNSDLTHIKEFYASEMYRANGLIYQHVGLTTFEIWNSHGNFNFGLCYLFEPASKSYVKNALESGETYMNMPTWTNEKKGTYGVASAKYGDLYKATYGAQVAYDKGPDLTEDSIDDSSYQPTIGIKDDNYGVRYPIYERKTNKKDEYNDDLLRNMINVVNTQSYEKVDQVVDLEYLAKEEAVAFYIGNPDSFRYNYNNYQMYFRRTDGKMIILPIDNDRAFGIGETWEEGVSFVNRASLSPLSSKNMQGDNNRNPLLAKTILSTVNNKCKANYIAHLKRLKESDWVKEETFNAYYEVARATYGGEATFAKSNGSNVSFGNFITNKITAVNNI